MFDFVKITFGLAGLYFTLCLVQWIKLCYQSNDLLLDMTIREFLRLA